MNVLRIIVLILALACLVSCAKSKGGSSKKVTILPTQIANLLENQKFECASIDGEKCPVGISRVFVLDLDDASQSELCTGFLTSTNRLVTNEHCVATQVQCDSTYFSIYTGSSYEVAKCRTLLAAESDNVPLDDKSVDYAVLELDRHIGTSSFDLAKSTPKLGESLTAWVVDHVDLFTGRITQLNCTVNNRIDSLELDDCAIISGNSGSPVTDSSRSIVGVIWGSDVSDYVNEETPLDERRELQVKAYATELKYFRPVLLR